MYAAIDTDSKLPLEVNVYSRYGTDPAAVFPHRLTEDHDVADTEFLMRIDRFRSFWRGSQSSAKRWLRRFRHYYNRDRPNQALDGRTLAEEVLK